ncbi:MULTISPECIES: 50S ribosomal protein L31 [Holospora]|uniref:50S ribosomal protein L31 n=2 Tax=Holospora TaxID=44747 RepID=A0A061JGW8_9PROT|nr:MULTISPECIES: 50S ribosomal protein L31 [Holospora]ETZ05345.1 50S ribosomal protein L31 [Holospora undulata HU1]GAJ46694.1 50S ribosomal protein L31 [Holospora elegans E1]
MKKNIHPHYHKVKVIMTNGQSFEVGSTYGKPGSELVLDIDPSCHPAWTGTHRMAPKGRGVEFENRFKGLSTFTVTKN